MSGGAPARGTSPRRPSRRHHHEPQQHQNYDEHRNNNQEDESEPLDDYEKSPKPSEESRPKVNPIFLWALQREQRIIEVRCEDYDKRNRIKLRKTAHGWRSIPRTTSNVYTTSFARYCHNCERVCESPAGIASLSSAASSPNSSRWSPAIITSSNLAPWSMSSASSTASSGSHHLATISSPSQESCETSREIGSSRSRNQSDGESLNDFAEDTCSRGPTSLLPAEDNSRKRRLRQQQNSRPDESEKKKKCLRSTSETNGPATCWSDRTDNISEDDSTTGSTTLDVSLDRRRSVGRKKRRRSRNPDGTVGKRKKHRRNSECQDTAGLPLVSSPKSWERLMNGTRFLNSGPMMDRESRKDDEEEKHEEAYEETDRCNAQASYFGSADLEKAKKSQHLQPRVVIEPLKITGITGDSDVPPKSFNDEPDAEGKKEIVEKRHRSETKPICHQERINFKGTEQKICDRTEVRDIFGMLDSTGSPVLATDTPTAHLPSSLDSTKTNISDCYENRDYLESRQRASDHEKIRSLTIRRTSANFSDTLGSVTSKVLGGTSRSDASSVNEREPLINGKIIRRESINETEASSHSDLGRSAEILEALRSTPGLSISVTTRTNIGEPRNESEQSLKHTSKQPSICIEKKLSNSSQQIRQSALSNSRKHKEIICSQESSNELPTMRFSERGPNGLGLATIVNRLSHRDNRQVVRRPEDKLVTNDEEKGRKPNGKIGLTTGSRLLPKLHQRNLQNTQNKIRRSENRKHLSKIASPAVQLRQLMDHCKIPIPDPLLVPRDRLPALAASPATEIPKLLSARPELRLPEALSRPDLLRDPDILVISLGHLQQVLDQGDGSVCEYNYRPPDQMEDEDEKFGEENELVEEDTEVDEEEEEEEEDQDVPEQSLDLDYNEAIGSARVRVIEEKPRNQRVPPKLISCKPIGSLMPGPIDLSRNCVFRNSNNLLSRPRQGFISGSRNHQSDAPSTQLPPPPLLRVRTGLLQQESQLTSNEIPSLYVQNDSHLWHPLFGSQKRQMQHQPQQQQQQQTHRTPWHRTTLAS